MEGSGILYRVIQAIPRRWHFKWGREESEESEEVSHVSIRGQKTAERQDLGRKGMALGVLHPETASTDPLSSLKREN